MKRITLAIIENPLIAGSGVIFIATFLSNIFNFFFNLFMSRNLQVSDYGTLASFVSIFTLLGLVANSFIPTIVQFAGKHFANNDLPMVRGLFMRITLLSIFIGVFFMAIFIVFADKIGYFFQIKDNQLIFISAFILCFIFLISENTGFLQARLAFSYIAFITILAGVLKFILGVGFVSLGFSVRGAILAYFSAFFVPYVASFFPIRDLFAKGVKSTHMRIGELFAYGMPSTIALLSLTSFITTDIILVKHFFSPADAGIYAGLAIVGKVIFFLSSPIGTVMFPIVVQKHFKGENYYGVFRLAFLGVLIPALLLTVFYFSFPEFTITFFLKKPEYLAASNLVGLYAVLISAYSLVFILTNYFLSIKKTFIYIPILVAAILQIMLIWVFHSSFFQVILESTVLLGVLLFILFCYYFKLSLAPNLSRK